MKFYRKQASLTQEKLAEKIGMSTSYIGDMEARERFPFAETIDKIADALDIPVSTLFGERSISRFTSFIELILVQSGTNHKLKFGFVLFFYIL